MILKPSTAAIARALRVVLLGCAALTLSACRMFSGASCHEHQVYEQARSIPSLRLPEGLKSPSTADALRIPPLKEPQRPKRSASEPCLESPPPFSTPKPAQPKA
jgi:uncharacterized lipoprotein